MTTLKNFATQDQISTLISDNLINSDDNYDSTINHLNASVIDSIECERGKFLRLEDDLIVCLYNDTHPDAIYQCNLRAFDGDKKWVPTTWAQLKANPTLDVSDITK